MNKLVKGLIVVGGVIMTGLGIKSFVDDKAVIEVQECDDDIDETEDADVTESDEE